MLGLYREGDDAHLARNAGLVEAHGYCRLTRIEEIMAFARRSGYSNLVSPSASAFSEAATPHGCSRERL